jgi:signal transduction histidine kinase
MQRRAYHRNDPGAASMKIVPKLTLALVTGICLVLSVNGYFRVKREVRIFESDRRHDHEMIGRSLGAAVASIWRTEGRSAAMSTLDAVNQHFDQIHVRFIGPAVPPEPGRKFTESDLSREIRVDPHVLAATPKGEPITVTAGSGTGASWYTYVPLELPDSNTGLIELSETAPVERHFAQNVATDAVSTALALATLSAIIAFVMGQWLVGGPVRALAEKARRTGRGDFKQPLVLRQKDEFAALAGELNAMAEQLVSTLQQLRHADRLMTVGQLASGIAHELGTPLNVISARATMLARGEASSDETKEYARVIVDAAGRMTKIIRQLLQFARRKGPQRAPASVAAVVREAMDLLRPLAKKRAVDLRVTSDDEATAEVELDQIQQVVTNLVMNGIQAIPDGGTVDVEITTERSTPPADVGGGACECVCLRVKDNGSGIAPDDLSRVFEPFFTTKDVGEGTGLGLAVTYGIVRDHGGWITVESPLREGTTFTVFLPRGASPDDAPRA